MISGDFWISTCLERQDGACGVLRGRLIVPGFVLRSSMLGVPFCTPSARQVCGKSKLSIFCIFWPIAAQKHWKLSTSWGWRLYFHSHMKLAWSLRNDFNLCEGSEPTAPACPTPWQPRACQSDAGEVTNDRLGFQIGFANCRKIGYPGPGVQWYPVVSSGIQWYHPMIYTQMAMGCCSYDFIQQMVLTFWDCFARRPPFVDTCQPARLLFALGYTIQRGDLSGIPGKAGIQSSFWRNGCIWWVNKGNDPQIGEWNMIIDPDGCMLSRLDLDLVTSHSRNGVHSIQRNRWM